MSSDKFIKIKKHLSAKQAMEAMISQDFEKAVELYSSAINCDPKDWKTYIQRCNCYQRLNRLEDALKDAETAIDLNPSQISGHFRKGCILMDKKEFRSAENSLKRGLECDPNDQNCKNKIKETHKLFLKEFGFDVKEVDILVEKYDKCSDISDALISGKLLKELVESDNRSVISSEIPRFDNLSLNSGYNVNESLNTPSIGSLPDFNDLANSLDTTEGDIRKPNTNPFFRSPKINTKEEVVNEMVRSDESIPSSKSTTIKTRPTILRSIKI